MGKSNWQKRENKLIHRTTSLTYSPFFQYGSPAEKDNLEVADEILDVNERKLEELSRTEVIRHIHEVGGNQLQCPKVHSLTYILYLLQCIQSCMIKLRVKRRSDSRLGNFKFMLIICSQHKICPVGYIIPCEQILKKYAQNEHVNVLFLLIVISPPQRSTDRKRVAT